MKQPLHVVYAGELGSPIADSFRAFLDERFASVRLFAIQDLASFTPDSADVLIVDGDGIGNSRHGRVTFDTFAIPTVLIGGTGGKISDQLSLKTGWARGCQCLDPYALVRAPEHPVFAGPWPVDLTTVAMDTPDHFREFTFDALPEKLEVVPVMVDRQMDREVQAQAMAALNAGDAERYNQLSSRLPWPGLVASGDGFSGPDTEWLAGGINDKGHDYVAIGRQGPFLMFGFWGSPEHMTEAGKAIFANCVTYIARFKDAKVETLSLTSPRNFLRTALAFLPEDGDSRQFTLHALFGDDRPASALGGRASRAQWFEENRPYVRYLGSGFHDGHYAVDEDVRRLGVANDDVTVLDRAIEQMRSSDLELGLRVFNRYTRQSVVEAGEAEAWLTKHREHLFFSDSMGYRFISRLDPPALRSDLSQILSSAQLSEWMATGADEGLLLPTLTARRDGDLVSVNLQVHVMGGWHAYAPGSTEGIPFDVFLPPDSPFEVVEPIAIPAPEDGKLYGGFVVTAVLRGAADVLELRLRQQLCDAATCRPPVERTLATEIFDPR